MSAAWDFANPQKQVNTHTTDMGMGHTDSELHHHDVHKVHAEPMYYTDYMEYEMCKYMEWPYSISDIDYTQCQPMWDYEMSSLQCPDKTYSYKDR